MDTNVKGVFFLTQKLIPLLKAYGTAADPARVISIGSIDGLTVSAFETPSYGTSKAAVHHLTRFMSRHLTGAHINFNNIALVLTPPGCSAPVSASAEKRKAKVSIGTWLDAVIRAAVSAHLKTSRALPSFSARARCLYRRPDDCKRWRYRRQQVARCNEPLRPPLRIQSPRTTRAPAWERTAQEALPPGQPPFLTASGPSSSGRTDARQSRLPAGH